MSSPGGPPGRKNFHEPERSSLVAGIHGAQVGIVAHRNERYTIPGPHTASAPASPKLRSDDAVAHFARALDALGFHADPELADTPRRVVEFLSEYRSTPLPEVQPLETRSTSPVIVRDLHYHSLCAHHLLPFFGTCTIAYRPNGAIAGLGWFPRMVASLAQRPQLQERLVEQIAAAVNDALQPRSVAVCLTARQMCVEMRGARARGAFEVTATAGETDPTLISLVQPR